MESDESEALTRVQLFRNLGTIAAAEVNKAVLAERIQSVLRAERDVRRDLYVPGSGQLWGHVDHRVARVVAEALCETGR